MNERDEQAFEMLGYAAGRAFAKTLRAFIDGYQDEQHAAPTPEPVGEIIPICKTRIADCRACWCDECLNIEMCRLHRDGQREDGIRPFPCIGCMDGMRFRPKEHKPDCDYQEGNGSNHG